MKFHASILALIPDMPLARTCRASQAGFMRLESPGKRYTLMLVPKSDPDDWGNRELRVLHGNQELTHYQYEGVLLKAYWLLSRNLVVLDNHNGHAVYGILVVSLADGSIITSHGTTHSAGYDRGEDMDYLPDLFAAAQAQMKKLYKDVDEDSAQMKRLYKDVDNDEMRLNYESAAIGWTPAQRIKVDADLEVTHERRLKWRNVSVRKVKCGRNEPKPAEMTRLDNLLMSSVMNRP